MAAYTDRRLPNRRVVSGKTGGIVSDGIRHKAILPIIICVGDVVANGATMRGYLESRKTISREQPQKPNIDTRLA